MMKTSGKLWSVVLSVCLLLTMLCAVPCAAEEVTFGDEVIKGGDFENLEWDDEKGTWGNWRRDSAKAATITAPVPYEENGTEHYLSLVATKTQTGTTEGSAVYEEDDAQVTQSAAWNKGEVLPNQLYMLSFRYKSSFYSQGRVKAYEYKDAEGKSTGGFGELKLPGTGGTWQAYTRIFYTAAESNSISFSLHGNRYYGDKTAPQNEVGFDDFSLRAVTLAETDVVTNLVAGEATDGGYKADADGNILLQAAPTALTSGDKVIVTGYVKASKGAAVTISASEDIALDSTGKALTGTGEWVPFELSGVPYGSNITLAATGTDVELKGLVFEKDANILQDTTFVSTANGGKWYHNHATDVSVLTDGDCPVGMNYLKVTRSSNARYASISGFATHTVGDRYLCSVWYKSDIDAGVMIEHKDLRSTSPQIDLPATSEWKRIEFVFEMFGAPTGGTVYLWLGIPKGRTTAGTAYFCAPRIEKLSDVKRNTFYAPCGSVMTTTDWTVTEEAATHMQILGEPVQSATGLDEVKAVYINGTTPSTGRIMMGAYTKDAKGAKQLLNVSVSEVLPSAGVAYPTATISTSELKTGDEVRAFLWDGISGLKPLEKAISITK